MDDFGIEARVQYGDGDPARWDALLHEWDAAGATHVTVNTMRVGLETPQEHMAAMETFAARVALSA
jgi:hypothetical protein